MNRDLRPLFAPRSVAIAGASADPSKWGNVLARGALRGAHRRRVFLVNRAGGAVLGERTYRSLGDLPEAPELAVLAVPAEGFEAAVDDALAVGTKALIGVTAGLGEHSDVGRRIEADVAARVREAGSVLLGPNCLGVFDAAEELDLGWSVLPAGSIALISQSGNLALELARLAVGSGLGFSRFVSLGNQADLVAADFFDELAAHEPTRVIALYLEDFRDGRAFVAAATRARAAGVPVVLIAGGTSEAGARAAVSHTGALVSEARAIEAACRAAGIAQVTTPARLLDAAQALLSRRVAGGRRVAVYADGGGHGIIAGDLLVAAGFELPALSDSTTAALREHLPATASVANPIDFAGGGERGLATYGDVGRLLLESHDADAVLLTGYFGGYAEDTPELADQELATAASLGVAADDDGVLVVHTSYPESRAAAELRRGRVPVYGDIEAAVSALALLAAQGEVATSRPEPDAGPALLEAPEATYAGARAFVERAGVPMTRARPVGTVGDALAAAAELGYPVVLKATRPVHKSESEGVAVGLEDADALSGAFAEVVERLGTRELSVEEMAPVRDGVELIVGVKRDPRFGPIVLVGLGGIYTEILDDVAVALAPIAEDEAERLLRSLRGAPLFLGARGLPPLAVGAAARAVAALSRAAAGCPVVEEVEVNPLLVLRDRAVGLDARVVVAS